MWIGKLCLLRWTNFVSIWSMDNFCFDIVEVHESICKQAMLKRKGCDNLPLTSTVVQVEMAIVYVLLSCWLLSDIRHQELSN